MKKWYQSKLLFLIICNVLMIIGLIMVFENTQIKWIRRIDFNYLTLNQWIVFIYAMIFILIGLVGDIILLIYYSYIVFKDKNGEKKTASESN